jgi:hypothetical protein
VILGDGTNGGQFSVPVTASGGLSFLGLTDPNRYSRIIVQSGTAVPGAADNLVNNLDVVFMDDFIYGEPQPSPAVVAVPATSLAGLAILALAMTTLAVASLRAPLGAATGEQACYD